jgi:DNA uptake protein ComE-like DNA-binding protein
VEHFVPVAKVKSLLGPLLNEAVPDHPDSLALEYRDELSALRDALDPALRDDRHLFHDAANASLLDLNSATIDELAGLPGINEELASRIMEKRPFERIDDLKAVDGIGERKIARIRKLIRV